jgi:hypothetical protein
MHYEIQVPKQMIHKQATSFLVNSNDLTNLRFLKNIKIIKVKTRTLTKLPTLAITNLNQLYRINLYLFLVVIKRLD